MNFTSLRRRSSQAFTLVELLVVIAIIGILVALLLPAIQAAREAARKSQCSNNMKQLMLGVILFEQAKKEYPAGAYWYDGVTPNCKVGGNPPCKDGWGTFITRILPYIEEQGVYDKIDFNTPYPGKVDFAVLPDGTPVGSVAIATVKCPSSEHPEPFANSEFPSDEKFKTFKLANYCASRGNTTLITNPSCSCSLWSQLVAPDGVKTEKYPDFAASKKFGGPFSRGSWGIKGKMVTDGLSKTIFLGEVRPECSENIDRGWHFSNSGQGVASTLIEINFDTCRKEDPENCRRWCNWVTELGFKSTHPGGAHFGMGDGSVQFINERIDLITYNRLGGKADGEAVTLE